jgi:hypothetical protein
MRLLLLRQREKDMGRLLLLRLLLLLLLRRHLAKSQSHCDDLPHAPRPRSTQAHMTRSHTDRPKIPASAVALQKSLLNAAAAPQKSLRGAAAAAASGVRHRRQASPTQGENPWPGTLRGSSGTLKTGEPRRGNGYIPRSNEWPRDTACVATSLSKTGIQANQNTLL